jgi:DnaJ like chaperone protein
MIFGKLIGGVLGLFSGGIVGAIVGVLLGHFFDRGLGRAMGFDFGADRERLQQLFFETTFSVMGHLAKADGRVSEQEVAQAEALIARVGLTAEHRQQAIEYFKRGSEADFQLEVAMARFVNEGGRGHRLPLLLLEFLVSMAMADGVIHPAEQDVLNRTAAALGINTRQFQQLLAMLLARHDFGRQRQYQQGGQAAASGDVLAKAYQALGVAPSDSDRDIKRAYRKLMSEHHPDKLIAKGVPEDMLKMATETTQEIQSAYELIKKSRKQ